MKNRFLTSLVIMTAVAGAVGCSRQDGSRVSEKNAVQTTAHMRGPELPDKVVPQAPTEGPLETTVAATPPAAPVLPPAAPKPSVAETLSPLVQTLVSRQASYAQRQVVWRQLSDAHQLDDAITELEHATTAEPSAAEYPTALGIAYVQKLRTLEDFREQSILAIKADKSFDQALELDPSNWDARFWKATSLSYWPEGLNKSGEVIENFVTLVEQQEKQPPQPQFAETYVRLGEQYQKAGYPEYARETWQRGAALFPADNTLRERLATAQ